MTTHADTQITETEAARLMLAALADPACRATLRTERAMAIGRREMLARWSLDTPEGAVHRVAVVRVLDGEPIGFDESYTDGADAVRVWEHLAAEYRSEQADEG